ncbi:MAG: hypothetical protein KBD01_15865 [Acidobacteria bacterium]|nr:hypothetical protein [Acidobacteriota bacterium]
MPEVTRLILAPARGPAGHPGDAQALVAADARASAEAVEALGAGWRLERRGGADGAVVLRGPAAPGIEPKAEAVRRLLARLPSLFPAGAGEERLRAVDAAGERRDLVRLRQVESGAMVQGAEVLAHFDEGGRLMSITSTYRPDLAPANRREVAEADAVATAAADLEAAVPGIERLGEPLAEAWVWPIAGQPTHVWLVMQATASPRGYYVTLVDAQTGAVLSREDKSQHGTRSGRGSVFRRNSDYPNRARTAKLPNLLDASENPDGFLEGERFHVIDDNRARAASTDFDFRYDPASQGELFDQVNPYYHFERARTQFAKTFRVQNLPHFDSGASLPVVVNDHTMCNAFYSPNLLGDGVPGFAFGDQAPCVDPGRDADVIYHEYAHGVVDWKGVPLIFGPVNGYQRALGEAFSDYFAAGFDKDPVVGEVFLESDTRTLDNHWIYPDDVPCSNNQREEHCTGLIYGGFLWDLRSKLKNKADRLAFQSLDYLADLGGGGQTAGIDFPEAALALIDADEDLNGSRAYRDIYAAAVSRGLFGTRVYGGDDAVIAAFEYQGKGKYTGLGELHKSGQKVPFFFRAEPGRTMTVRVVGKGGVSPTFVFGNWNGGDAGGPITPISGPDTESGNRATLKTELPDVPGFYVIEVADRGSATGPFKILIAVK